MARHGHVVNQIGKVAHETQQTLYNWSHEAFPIYKFCLVCLTETSSRVTNQIQLPRFRESPCQIVLGGFAKQKNLSHVLRQTNRKRSENQTCFLLFVSLSAFAARQGKQRAECKTSVPVTICLTLCFMLDQTD